MLVRLVRFAAAALVAYALLTPAEASAKFFLITTGDKMTELGIARGPDGETAKVGYKYSYGGVFWLDFWTWDGTYCIIAGENQYFPLSESQASELLGKPPGSLSPPFMYRFPLGLMILGGLAVIGVLGAIIKKSSSGTAPAPAPDNEKYESAG